MVAKRKNSMKVTKPVINTKIQKRQNKSAVNNNA